MSTGVRLPLAEALPIARGICERLQEACLRLEIAGSIRRRKPDVGDIELVAIPRLRNEPASLWGDVTQVSLLAEKIGSGGQELGLERLSGGEHYVKLQHDRSGMQVDLFITSPDQWGLIFLIRTGPADYSQWLVTYARRRGLHVCAGWLRIGLAAHDEPTFRDCGRQVIATPEERDVYKALGLPFVEPADRRVP